MPITVVCSDGVAVELTAEFEAHSQLCIDLNAYTEPSDHIKSTSVASETLQTLLRLQPDPRAIYHSIHTIATLDRCYALMDAAAFFGNTALYDALSLFQPLMNLRGQTPDSLRATYADLLASPPTEHELSTIRSLLGCPVE